MEKVESLEQRTASLEAENESLREELVLEREKKRALKEDLEDLQELSNMVEDLNGLEEALEELEELKGVKEDVEDLDDRFRAMKNGLDSAHEKITEIQERELDKGGHLKKDNVFGVDIPDDKLDVVRKDDGKRYYRKAGTEEDPIAPDNQITLAAEDLLPIQQLAHLPDEMLTNEKRPVEIAALVWRDREQSRPDLWQKGSKSVNEYLDGGDLARWIQYNNDDVDHRYAKTLAGRVMDALIEFANNRLYKKKKSKSASGLNYRENRLILPSDSEIPGETAAASRSSPETSVVTG